MYELASVASSYYTDCSYI